MVIGINIHIPSSHRKKGLNRNIRHWTHFECTSNVILKSRAARSSLDSLINVVNYYWYPHTKLNILICDHDRFDWYSVVDDGLRLWTRATRSDCSRYFNNSNQWRIGRTSIIILLTAQLNGTRFVDSYDNHYSSPRHSTHPLHPLTPTAQLNRRRLGLISVFVVDNTTSTIKWNGSFLHRDTINGG